MRIAESLKYNLASLAPLLARSLLASALDLARIRSELVDVLALLGPLEYEVSAEQMRVLERGHDGLCLAPGVEVEEGESSRTGVELLGQTDRLEGRE